MYLSVIPIAALIILVVTPTVTNGQSEAYNFDISPESRLFKSLGLNIPSNADPIPITTTRISSSRVLSSSYEPATSLYLSAPQPKLLSNPKQVTYLTVGDRPRPKARKQTVLTVVDSGRRRKQNPVPLAPAVNDLDEKKPYSFSYETNDDELGIRSSRSEQSDGKIVSGSYSYYDPDGVYRIVEYIADENGFKANVKTNEPGTARSSTTDPANTNWEIESPPEAVLSKYLNKY